MALYPRLLGQGAASGHIDPDRFVDAVLENIQDKITIAQVADMFSLDADEVNDTINFGSALYFPGYSEGTIPEGVARSVLNLGRAGLLYTTEQEVRDRLGL